MEIISIIAVCMTKIATVPDIIALWPSRPELARDINAQPGKSVTVDRIHKWAQGRSIPAHYHARIIRAAEGRGFDLTAVDMVQAHDAKGEDAA